MPSWNRHDGFDDDESEDHEDFDDLDDEDFGDLDRCPECDAEVYADAERCPACGHWITDADRIGGTGKSDAWVKWLAVLLLIVFALTLLTWGVPF